MCKRHNSPKENQTDFILFCMEKRRELQACADAVHGSKESDR